MKHSKNQSHRKLRDLKKIEAAIKDGFAESEELLKKNAEAKRSGFQLCFV